jgi:hypothetical protein
VLKIAAMIAEFLVMFYRIHFVISNESSVPRQIQRNGDYVALAGKAVEVGDFVGVQDGAALLLEAIVGEVRTAYLALTMTIKKLPSTLTIISLLSAVEWGNATLPAHCFFAK